MSRETTVLPAQDTARLDATEALLRTNGPVSLTGGDQSVELPTELRTILADVVTAMRRGQGVTFASLSQQLTTQQAADLLGISRPTLIKLLDEGQIAFQMPGRHRRLRLSDVLEYQALTRRDRRKTLKELAQEAQDFGLYEAEPQTFTDALSEGRRKNA